MSPAKFLMLYADWSFGPDAGKRAIFFLYEKNNKKKGKKIKWLRCRFLSLAAHTTRIGRPASQVVILCLHRRQDRPLNGKESRLYFLNCRSSDDDPLVFFLWNWWKVVGSSFTSLIVSSSNSGHHVRDELAFPPDGHIPTLKSGMCKCLVHVSTILRCSVGFLFVCSSRCGCVESMRQSRLKLRQLTHSTSWKSSTQCISYSCILVPRNVNSWLDWFCLDLFRVDLLFSSDDFSKTSKPMPSC